MEAIEGGAVQHQFLACPQFERLRLGGIGLGIAHAQLQGFGRRGAFRPGHGQINGRITHRLHGLYRQAQFQLAALGEVQRAGGLAVFQLHRPINAGHQLVGPGRTIHIVDLDQDARGVARCHEGRQAGAHHHRIAHLHVAAGFAHATGGPGNSHQLQGSVEVGHVEGNSRRAVIADFNNAGEQGHRLLVGRRGLEAGAAVTAGAHRAACAGRAVDQLAVKVTDLDAEAALAEVPGTGLRCLVAREIEDAHIHGSQRHIGLVASRQVGKLQGCGQLLTRAHGVRRGDLHRQLALARLHLAPGKADAAGGHALGVDVHRPQQGRRHIGPCPPVIRHRQADFSFRTIHFDGFRFQQALAKDIDHGNAFRLRLQAQDGRFTGAVGGLVEAHFQPVRRIGRAAGRVPAGREGVAGFRRLTAPERDFQLVLTPVHRQGKPCRTIGGNVDLAGGHPFAGGHRFEVPLAVAAVPLIAAVDARQGPGDTLACNLLAVFIDEHDLVIRRAAFIDTA